MSRKKGSDEGTVYYRKDRDKWIAQYFEVDPVSQNSIKKSKGFNTQEQAKAYLQSIMFQKENPIYIEKHGIPLKDLMNSILQNKFDTNGISEAQYERVQRTIKTISKGAIVDKNIGDITPNEIQMFVNTFKDYSDSSIKKIFEQFNQAFRYAFDRGYILRNPMTQVVRPKSNKQDKLVRAMTLEEENQFINYIQDKSIKECPYKNEFLIQLFMGLRIGECLALSHNDIDLMNRKIYVHKTLTRNVNGTISLSNSPKTQAGNRYLPIPDSLYPYIVEQMNYSNEQENNGDKLLFKPPYNKYTTLENVNRALTKILDELNIERMTSHSLRHTYATRAIEAGVTPVVLQKLMGHTDVSITLNTYTSVFDKYKQTELEKVNEYYMKQNLLQDKKDNLLLERTNNIKDIQER
ncbi:MAG: site-specific integrase [Clostridia bacterium]|nr:site-specific integrase [Clostridia bacterium]